LVYFFFVGQPKLFLAGWLWRTNRMQLGFHDQKHAQVPGVVHSLSQRGPKLSHANLILFIPLSNKDT